MQAANCGIFKLRDHPVHRCMRAIVLAGRHGSGRRRPVFQIDRTGLFGAAQRIMYSAHLLPNYYRTSKL